jgi:SOCE-associated regulatory factor of calcium homoeostasis
VSCEGWSGPGDSYVLKGTQKWQRRSIVLILDTPIQDLALWSTAFRRYRTSCDIQPRISTQKRGGPFVCRFVLIWRKVNDADHPKVETAALYLCIGLLAFVLYKLLRPCFGGYSRPAPPRMPRSRPSSNSSWFPGGHDDNRRPPPPYSKYPSNTDNTPGSTGTSQARDGQDGLGFWSGAALGGLGTYLLTRQRNSDSQPRPYDWENERYFPRQRPGYQAQPVSGTPSRHPSSSSQRDNRGEGPSGLGPMMSSTSYGGSTVR